MESFWITAILSVNLLKGSCGNAEYCETIDRLCHFPDLNRQSLFVFRFGPTRFLFLRFACNTFFSCHDLVLTRFLFFRFASDACSFYPIRMWLFFSSFGSHMFFFFPHLDRQCVSFFLNWIAKAFLLPDLDRQCFSFSSFGSHMLFFLPDLDSTHFSFFSIWQNRKITTKNLRQFRISQLGN